ncbi:MAG: hypothetical protein LUH11_01875 [Candidatus Gastranaerophilales bacterium]|nr:hypothetical protein [Candidatus Gastranaerophilales bacterium]
MGLAASQARFLGITARKSNIEYEGQQVNQQRTALAEEVNSLYTELLSLSVPIAPDTTDYYESNYSFTLDNTDNQDGEYIVKSYYQNDDGTYYLNTERTYTKNVAAGTVLKNSSITSSTTTDDDGNETTVYTLNTTDGSYTLNSNAQNSSSMISLINSTYGEGTISDDSLYYYQDDDGVTHYISSSAVEGYTPDASLSSYISTTSDVTESVVFSNATVTFDQNNRFSTISAYDPTTGASIFGTTDVSTTRTYDSDGYDAALRDYTMSKDEYDKKVADLNARTETLQNEDKILELRLDQIDTEQNELQTELDAVKAVLDKNIENTFNTFS